MVLVDNFPRMKHQKPEVWVWVIHFEYSIKNPLKILEELKKKNNISIRIRVFTF